MSALTLRPAIRKKGKVYPGKEGGSHADIIKAKALGMKSDDNEHGFVDPKGKFLDRKEGLQWLEKSRPALYEKLAAKDVEELRSHDLPRKSMKQKMVEEDL